MTTRYFIVFSHYLPTGASVNASTWHTNGVKLTKPLTLAALQCAVSELDIHRTAACYIQITGYNEVTEEEYKTFFDRDDNFPRPSPPPGDCTLI